MTRTLLCPDASNREPVREMYALSDRGERAIRVVGCGNGSAGRILAVDDDAVALRSYHTAIPGERLEEAHSVPEAMAAYRHSRPLVVLLRDIVEAKSALDLVPWIRLEGRKHGEPLILVVSGGTANLVAAESAGADLYLIEPFHVGSLSAIVVSYLHDSAPSDDGNQP